MNALQALRGPALPAPAALPAWADRVLVILTGAFGLVLPYSVAGTSLLLALLLLLAVANAPHVWRSQPWREPTFAVGLLLFAWIALHTLALDGWSAGARGVLSRYKELLLAPVLFALFRMSSRPQVFLYGLLAGAAGYALAHWATRFSELMVQATALRYIAAGYEFAVLAFLLLVLAPSRSRPWLWRAGALFFAATTLFALPGRTGHIVLICLVVLAAVLQVPPRWRIVTLAVLPLVLVGVAGTSTKVQQRWSETMNALQDPSYDPTSSSAVRMQLIKHGVALAREHFAIGGGYARYGQLHSEMVRRTYGNDPQRQHLLKSHWVGAENPHAEYLMQVVGGGVVALALFLAWLCAPLLRRRSDGSLSPALLGVALSFAVGGLFNSMLMDFVEGHFYMALLAWLLADAARPPVPATKP